eukprot:128453_1
MSTFFVAGAFLLFWHMSLSREYILLDISNMQWSGAQQYCVDSYSTSLATITTSKELSKCTDLMINAGVDIAWIGLNNENKFAHNLWKWNSAESLSQCVYLHKDGHYKDAPCDQLQSAFICNAETLPRHLLSTPTLEPTQEPTFDPTVEPTLEPTLYPTLQPSSPTLEPTDSPTLQPTTPTLEPTAEPTPFCSDYENNNDIMLANDNILGTLEISQYFEIDFDIEIHSSCNSIQCNIFRIGSSNDQSIRLPGLYMSEYDSWEVRSSDNINNNFGNGRSIYYPYPTLNVLHHVSVYITPEIIHIEINGNIVQWRGDFNRSNYFNNNYNIYFSTNNGNNLDATVSNICIRSSIITFQPTRSPITSSPTTNIPTINPTNIPTISPTRYIITNPASITPLTVDNYQYIQTVIDDSKFNFIDYGNNNWFLRTSNLAPLKNWHLVLKLLYNFEPKTSNSTIQITMYGTKGSADLDMFYAFSVNDKFFTFANDFDGGLTMNDSSAGIFIYPACNSQLQTGNASLLMNNAINTTLNRQSLANGDVNNWYTLTTLQNDNTWPVTFTFTNNDIDKTLTFQFESATVNLQCTFLSSFDTESIFNFYISPDIPQELSIDGFDVSISTLAPTKSPTMTPTNAPSISPSQPPIFSPSIAPSLAPSLFPSISPSNSPTQPPSFAPSFAPSNVPSFVSSLTPTLAPSLMPSLAPSNFPSISPSNTPTQPPTNFPSISPSNSPTQPPSNFPSIAP